MGEQENKKQVWKKRSLRAGKALECVMRIDRDALVRKLQRDFVPYFQPDMPEEGGYYFRDFTAQWTAETEELLIHGDMYRNVADASAPRRSVLGVRVKAEGRKTHTYVVVYYDNNETQLSFALCGYLVNLPGAETDVIGGEWANPTDSSSYNCNAAESSNSAGQEVTLPTKDAGRPPEPYNEAAYQTLVNGGDSPEAWEEAFADWFRRSGRDSLRSQPNKADRDAFRKAMKRARDRAERT